MPGGGDKQRRVSVWLKSVPKFATFAPMFEYTEWEQLMEYDARDLMVMGLPGNAAVPLSKIIDQLRISDGKEAPQEAKKSTPLPPTEEKEDPELQKPRWVRAPTKEEMDGDEADGQKQTDKKPGAVTVTPPVKNPGPAHQAAAPPPPFRGLTRHETTQDPHGPQAASDDSSEFLPPPPGGLMMMRQATMTDAHGGTEAEAEGKGEKIFDARNIGVEDFRAVPFELPKGLADVDAKFMTRLLRHRRLIGEGDSVVSQEESGVGVTAGFLSAAKRITVKLSAGAPASCPTRFVIKTWPEVELAPKPVMLAIFKSDIYGYSKFEWENFYPRPGAFLACHDDASACALIMEDCNAFGTHAVHETPLTLQQVKMMIPKLAQIAAHYEGVHATSHPLHPQVAHMRHWTDVVKSLFRPMLVGAPLMDEMTSGKGHPLGEATPFHDDPADFIGPFHCWQTRGLGTDFAQLFTRCLDDVLAQVQPENATCSISHGDLRGDNIFLSSASPHGWVAIDFQMNFLGPVVSDLAFLMSSGTVDPKVYQNHADELLQQFYDEFKRRSRSNTTYTFEQCRKEFMIMCFACYANFFGMGASALQAATRGDGFLGSRVKGYQDETPTNQRRRQWYRAFFNNASFMFQKFGARQMLEKCNAKPIDFKAAFDYTQPRGPPKPKTPRVEEGKADQAAKA